VGDLGVAVRATSPRFAAWLDDTLADHRDPDPRGPLYSVVIGEQAAGSDPRLHPLHILYRGVEALCRTMSIGAIGRAVLNELEVGALRTRGDAIFLNAAVAGATGHGVVLLPSFPPRWVEDVARGTARSGARVSTSLATAIDPGDGRLLPISPLLSWHPSDLARLESMGFPDGPNDRFFVDGPTSVSAIVFPSAEAHPLRPLPRAEAVHRLARSAFNLRVLGSSAVEAIAHLTRGANVYEIGDLKGREIAGAIGELLSR
jgi:hypothetical protein